MEYRVVNSDSNVAELVTNRFGQALRYLDGKKGAYLILDEDENILYDTTLNPKAHYTKGNNKMIHI